MGLIVNILILPLVITSVFCQTWSGSALAELANSIEETHVQLGTAMDQIGVLKNGHAGIDEVVALLNNNVVDLIAGQEQIKLLLAFLLKLENVTIEDVTAQDGDRDGRTFGGMGLASLLSGLFAALGGTSPATTPAPGLISNNPALSFVKNGLVPDIITTAPSKLLQVRYAGPVNTMSGITVVTPGALVTNQNGLNVAPTVTFPEAVAGAVYTIMMVDPDVPSRHTPAQRSLAHWVETNIPAADLIAGLDVAVLNNGRELAAYLGPNPPQGSGRHRYVFLAFLQNGGNLAPAPPVIVTRTGFSVHNFVINNNLNQVPVAGNFFFAKF